MLTSLAAIFVALASLQTLLVVRLADALTDGAACERPAIGTGARHARPA